MATSSRFVAAFEVSQARTEALVRDTERSAEPTQRTCLPVHPAAWSWLIGDLVDTRTAWQLRHLVMGQTWLAAPSNGYQAQYRPGEVPGSWRASWFCPELAQALWSRLRSSIPQVRTADVHTTVDWDGHGTWRPVGVNPLMRFIRYAPGGELVAHYDGPYVWDAQRRTLLSLVLYLSDAGECDGGATRFLRDPQLALPLAQRDLQDQPARGASADVLVCVSPRVGQALVFDHRLLHDADLVRSGEKLILRTDVVFEKGTE